jgi:protein-tyrosine phosphatase
LRLSVKTASFFVTLNLSSNMKILMVCLGNICRSPLAEGLLRKHLGDKGITIDSAGTSSNHAGEAPDPRTRRNALQNGLNLEHLRARQFHKSDFGKFDMIYVMDKSNLRNVLALAENAEQKNKVKLLLEEAYPGSEAEVPDPWYGEEEGFQKVFELLDKACLSIAQKITRHQAF